ncbi:MAG: phenylacetate--CoA ligase family protein [Spirochaetota bacterium]|nr:MAG: phenylacetate--CoA ligase family protein [Spirochaetota bacterium]
MSVDLNFRDFFHPVSILKLRRFLEKSQWFSQEKLQRYQLNRLRVILSHAYENVPYYRSLFSELQFNPQDVTSLDDLKKIPILTKDIVRKNFNILIARNAKSFNPVLTRTSGTSGESVEFYLDRPSNILEFCYYWRYWSWAGYRIGDTFAEFGNFYFLTHREDIHKIHHFNPFTKRLILNGILFSYENIDKYIEVIDKHKPLFLKGLASTLYIFALFLKKRGQSNLSFKAVFSTGEMLIESQRAVIEEVFQCKVFDSYGHMERTVAISECPNGGYHINLEYGIMEIEQQKNSNEESRIGRIIGTSLHNFSMPLLRYDVGDLVEIKKESIYCSCKRGLPLIGKIHGRQEDSVITPDGRVLTSIYMIFELVEDIEFGQIIQKDKNRLVLRIVKKESYSAESETKLLSIVRDFVGDIMKIDIDYTNIEEIKKQDSHKFRVVVSNCKWDMN